jgi:ABC-2 type transport system permease protein
MKGETVNGTKIPSLENSQRQTGARFDDVRIIWALFTKDVLEVLKNKNAITVLLTSLFMVLFYSVLPALSGLDEAPNLLVYDGGSSNLVPQLDGSRKVDLYTYPTEEQMKQVLTHGTVPELGLVIPADFDRAIQAGENPGLEGYVLRWVSEAEAEELRLAAESEISALVGKAVSIKLAEERVELLPDSGGLGETASFALAFVLIMTGVILVPNLMLEEKQNRTLEALSVSPASAGHIITGKALAGIFYCSLGGMVALLINRILVVHWWLAILTVLAGALFTVSIGLWLGIKIDSRSQLSLWSWIILLPLIMPLIFSLLQGLIPEVWVRISSVVPSTVILQLSKASFANPIPLGKTFIQIIWVLVVAGAGLGCSIWLMRRRDRQASALSSHRQPSPSSASSTELQSSMASLQERSVQKTPGETIAASPALHVGGLVFEKSSPRGNLAIIGVIAAKDLLEALKNRLILSILLGSTFILLSGSLLPLLLSQKNLPRIAVYDQGRSSILRDLAAREDMRVSILNSQADMESALVNSVNPALGLVITADFDQRTGEGQPIELQTYYPHWAASKQLSQLEAFFEEQLSQATKVDVLLNLPGYAVYPPVDLSGRPAMLLLNIITVILVIGIALVPLLMIEEKESQTLKVLLVSPASLKQVVAGKALVGLFYSMLPALPIMLLYHYLFIHWGVALLAVFLTAALAVGMGLLLGLLVDSSTNVSMWGALLLLFVIGSGLLKLFGLNLPQVLQTALEWLPGVAMMELFSISQAGDFPTSLLWLNIIALMAAITAVTVLLAWRVYHMERT